MNVFDSGCFRLCVPDGWMAFCGSDSSGKITPKKVHIYKGISAETEIFTHAGITVCLFGRGEYYFSSKGFYDNVRDKEPFDLGTYTWNCYTCTSLGYPYTMLDTQKDGCVLQIMILEENAEHRISIADPDVRQIIESLTVTA